MTELERLLSQDNCCLVSVASIKKALEHDTKTGRWIIHPKGVYAHLVCDKCLSCAPLIAKQIFALIVAQI